MITDPISDMLTRIRNASAVRKADVLIPNSKLKQEIAKLLKHENFIGDFEVLTEGVFPQLKISLKYEGKEPAINHIERISTPGRRTYVAKDELPIVLNGMGVAIISTSSGLMTNKQAKRAGVGGELLCKIW